MKPQHVETELRPRCAYYENMVQQQKSYLHGQLTKALRDKNMGTVLAAKALVIEFNIYDAKYNPFGNK